MITLYKGDDTGGLLGRTISIQIKTPKCVPLTGCTAEFLFDGIVKSWTDIEPGQYVDLFYSHNETSLMALGERFAVLRIIDSSGKIRTIDDHIQVCVTNRLEKVYPGCSKASYCVGNTVLWDNIIGRPASIVQTVNHILPDQNGNVDVKGGSGEGTVKSVNNISPDPKTGNVQIADIVDIGVKVSNLIATVTNLQKSVVDLEDKVKEMKTGEFCDQNYITHNSMSEVAPIHLPLIPTMEDLGNKVNEIIETLRGE